MNTKELSEVFKTLPATSVTDKPRLLAFDAAGVPGRLDSASVVTSQKSVPPAAAVESEWTRVAVLGAFTSGSHVFAGDIFVFTPWGSSATTLLHFSLGLCTASWDYNKGNATEKLTVEPRLNMTSPFTKGRLVVEPGGGDVKTVYLELFRGVTTTSTDYRKPYVEIRAVYDSTNSATPMTAVAGSVPSGAVVSQEFSITPS